MRRRHNHKRKNQKKIIIVSLVGLFLIMSAGYAAFSTNINITAKGTIKFDEGCIVNKVWEYDYKENAQEFITPCKATYKIELWGASGGSNSEIAGGKGAYVSGNISLNRKANLYIYTGKAGTADDKNNRTEQTITGGYNGGGYAHRISLDSANGNYPEDSSLMASSGGGATDIRLLKGNWNDFSSLKSRIIVAAGGGGYFYDHHYKEYAWESFVGGAAGGLEGYKGIRVGETDSGNYTNEFQATGATQTAGGIGYQGYASTQTIDPTGNGRFGIGGPITTPEHANAGGGGGYYGGATAYCSSGAGGSSFISGHDGCDAITKNSTENNIIHTGQSIHYSGYKFTDTVMIDGAGYKWTTTRGNLTGMPTHNGTNTMTGNEGNGYVKITLISRN